MTVLSFGPRRHPRVPPFLRLPGAWSPRCSPPRGHSARQSGSLAPALRCDKFPPPQATLILPRNEFREFGGAVARNSPPVSHHRLLNKRFSGIGDAARSMPFSAKGKKGHLLIADQFSKKLRRFLAAGIDRIAEHRLLLQFRGIHDAVKIHFSSIAERD